MSTQFQFGGNTLNAVYLDYGATYNGDGTTPDEAAGAGQAGAFNVPPSTINDNDAWIIRRTAYNAAKVVPTIANTTAANFVIIGCPRTAAQSPFGVKDTLYDVVPSEVYVAWGADSEQWAYITAGANNTKVSFTVLYDLVLAGIKVQRAAGVTSTTNYFFDVTKTNTPATYANRHTNLFCTDCSFGRAGEDVDDPSFVTQIANDGLFQYVHMVDCGESVFNNCIINFGAASAATSYHAFSFDNIWKIAASNVKVNKVTGNAPTGTTCSAVWNMNTAGLHKCMVESFVNYTETILINGAATASNKIQATIYGGAAVSPMTSSLDYLVMRNIAVTMPRVLGSPNRSSLALQLVDGVFKFKECLPKYCDIQDINVNLDKVWIYPSGNQVLALNLASTISLSTGATRKIKNVNIQFGEDPLVAYGTFAYAGNDTDDYNYFPLYINANNTDNGIGGGASSTAGDPFIVDSITVNNERGKAASFFGVQVSNSTFKGAVNFGAQTKADITSVSSWFPGAFIKMGVAATVHIGTVTAKTDNASYPYTTQIVTYSVAAVGISLVVDHCTTSLASDTKTTAETYLNLDYALVCKSAWEYLGNVNYFTADSFNHYARSVNMPRTGGAIASIAFNSLKMDNISPLIIGRAPMLGAQVTVGSTGRYRLSYYVATQTGAFSDLTMISRRFKIKVRVPQNAGGDVYSDCYSDICGVYKTDATSVWSNVSVGGMWRIDTYINCPTTNPVSVEFEFNWYGTGVFLLDPQYELVSAT